MDPSSVYIIVPAYNESAVLRASLSPLIDAGYTVVVVNDGSRDDSRPVLESMPVVAVHHLINLGQGAALQTGMEYARRHGAKAVIHFDADGQHDYRQIPVMLEAIESGEADVVLGSRFMRPDDASRVPWIKRVILRAGIVISWASSGVWLTDTHNGFRALSPKAIERINLTQSGFAHATEILSEIRRNKLRYVERPVTICYSDYSKAKGQSPANAINIVIDLLLGRIFR